MTCAEYRRWLSPYVDERLSVQERDEMERHLTACASCRDELASLQRMLVTLRELGPVQAPDLLPGFRRKLAREPWWRAALHRVTAPWPASLPVHSLALAVCSLMVLLVVGLLPSVLLTTGPGQHDRLSIASAPQGRLQEGEKLGVTQEKRKAGLARTARGPMLEEPARGQAGARLDAHALSADSLGRLESDVHRAGSEGSIVSAPAPVGGAAGWGKNTRTATPELELAERQRASAPAPHATPQSQSTALANYLGADLEDFKENESARALKERAADQALLLGGVRDEASREISATAKVQATVAVRGAGAPWQVQVAPEDQICQTDSDCTTVAATCLSCDCGEPVNRQMASTYWERLRTLCAEPDGHFCDASCPDSLVTCLNQRCTLNPPLPASDALP